MAVCFIEILLTLEEDVEGFALRYGLSLLLDNWFFRELFLFGLFFSINLIKPSLYSYFPSYLPSLNIFPLVSKI